MSTQIISGRNAAVNGVVCMSEVTARIDAFDQPIWCSASDGGAIRVDSNYDWSATYRAYGGSPLLLPGVSGNEFSFSPRSPGTGYQADDCVGGDLRVVWPVESGGPIWHELTVECNGEALTAGGTQTDAGTPGRVTSKGITTAGLTNVTEIQLIIRAHNAMAQGDSSSDGWAIRDDGNIDAFVTVKAHRSSFAAMPAINSYQTLTISAGDDGDWVLNRMKLLRIEPEIDVEGRGSSGRPKLVTATAMFGWDAMGNITAPGGGTLP